MAVNVCIIHSEDTNAWSSFIAERLSDSCIVKPYDDIQLIAKIDGIDASGVMKRADVVVIMFSPSLLQTLVECPSLSFNDLTAKESNRMLVYCGLTHQDLIDNHVIDRFIRLENWKHVTVGEADDQANEMVQCVQDCADSVIKTPKAFTGRVALPGLVSPGKGDQLQARTAFGAKSPRDSPVERPQDFTETQPMVPPRGPVTVPIESAKDASKAYSKDHKKKQAGIVTVYPQKVPCMVGTFKHLKINEIWG